ncbi:MAG: calcium/proton exchanger [Oscillatoriales cyanobacterium C42_A2020_001]|nr:calcium/proton exchanger [Leptolyngbyaceae cyanobacterium C42_A2020_001]
MRKNLIPLILLIFVPLSIAADLLDWGDFAIFVMSALAIVPLSIWLSTATEKVAVVTGPSIGGLVNAFFGNATELIISLVALKEGLIDIVKASITGTLLSDLLLLMGLAMLTGGIRYKEQEFKPILARVNGSSMTLAVAAIALPTLVINTSNVVDEIAIRNLSLVTATVLITVYGLTLLFSLKTHSYLYAVGLTDEENLESSEQSNPRSKLFFWFAILLVSTIAVAFESDLFVDVVDSETARLGLTPLFTGVILIPLISDMAAFVMMIRLATKNQMDLTVATATGDSLLVALFVAPVLVFVGLLIHQPIDLNFNPFQVIAVAIAVAITNLLTFSGRSNWLDGSLLLATYIVIGFAFYYHPA